MLYLIGLGLNPKGISKEGMLIVEKCHKVYLEGYTVDFPYELEELKLGKPIEVLGRKDVESNRLIKEAKGRKIALLVYGCPLFATTHMTLIEDAKEQEVKIKVIYAASVFDGLAETGLQLYKFGKITSMPTWKQSFEPDSFLEIVEDNKKIRAHSLILIDIGLGFKKALLQFQMACSKRGFDVEKMLVCSNVGTENFEAIYGNFETLREHNFKSPFCFIIPSELHFLEKDVLERFK